MGNEHKLLTIEMVRAKFPVEARPSARLLRETAQRLGLGRRWGRTYYLTEAEAEKLILTGSDREPARPSRIIRPPRYRTTVDLALERSKQLEKLGLK